MLVKKRRAIGFKKANSFPFPFCLIRSREARCSLHCPGWARTKSLNLVLTSSINFLSTARFRTHCRSVFASPEFRINKRPQNRNGKTLWASACYSLRCRKAGHISSDIAVHVTRRCDADGSIRLDSKNSTLRILRRSLRTRKKVSTGCLCLIARSCSSTQSNSLWRFQKSRHSLPIN